MIVIDKLCYQSKLRYMNTGEKFLFTMITLLFCIISRSLIIAAIVLTVNGILTIKMGGIPFFRYRKLMGVPLVFLFLSTATILVNFSKVPLDAFAVSVGSIYITGSFQSLRMGIQLIATALASVSCLYFLSLNTPMTDIMDFLRRIHCPVIIIELMLLIYRFIFVLLDTASAITTSQHSRLGSKDFRTSVKSFGALGSTLFIRAMKKSNALYDAMESRCYDGRIRVLSENHPVNIKEIVWIVVFEIFLLAVCLVERGMGWKI